MKLDLTQFDELLRTLKCELDENPSLVQIPYVEHNSNMLGFIKQVVAECRRLQAENAKLREALNRCAGFIAPLPDDDDSECALIYEQARAALRGE